ncbi:IS3 family transposase [Priestia koreensis]|uniref:IS3 family transposase n=1 Tax=Priestia koreensis TaxID=284581 RepID=UPI0033424F2A
MPFLQFHYTTKINEKESLQVSVLFAAILCIFCLQKTGYIHWYNNERFKIKLAGMSPANQLHNKTLTFSSNHL